METKKFRDPLYGYVEIDSSIVHDIIDTATFQRLRNIRQTSYAPLYPASLQNRFVHSLGVYHLGKMASKSLETSLNRCAGEENSKIGELKKLFPEGLDRYKFVFELACLLHDVGHAPFSHTGEEFYKKSKSCTGNVKNADAYNYLGHLSDLTDDEVFVQKAEKAPAPAPHEIMSCIVSIEAFGNMEKYFNSSHEKSFFSRCITGLKYDEVVGLTVTDYTKMTEEEHNETKRKMVLNCFIQLLHSSVIDVDRLDYIIRDASTMGYQNVSVDYERLLMGIEVVFEDDYNFTVGFHKNAISVIENAVYAHDNEKKWIQGHPTILYDSFLLQKSIAFIEKKISGSNPNATSTFFSYDSLTENGSDFGEIKTRYLCDADLIYIMKNVYRSDYSNEYFSRNSRRLPVWKSESEFRNLFNHSERKIINRAMNTMMTDNDDPIDFLEIADKTIVETEAEIKKAHEDGLMNKVRERDRKNRYFKKLLDVCRKHKIAPNVVLLSTSFFKSNFSKGEVQKLIIWFPNGRNCLLQEVSTTLSSSKPSDSKMLYLYYYPREGRETLDAHEFARDLIQAFGNMP